MRQLPLPGHSLADNIQTHVPQGHESQGSSHLPHAKDLSKEPGPEQFQGESALKDLPFAVQEENNTRKRALLESLISDTADPWNLDELLLSFHLCSIYPNKKPTYKESEFRRRLTGLAIKSRTEQDMQNKYEVLLAGGFTVTDIKAQREYCIDRSGPWTKEENAIVGELRKEHPDWKWAEVTKAFNLRVWPSSPECWRCVSSLSDQYRSQR